MDHYIKSEVAAGKRSKCTFLISPSEIPTSPVFSPLDLIMIPSDDDIRPSNVKVGNNHTIINITHKYIILFIRYLESVGYDMSIKVTN